MTVTAWTGAEYDALIDRLIADLARTTGLTIPQVRMRYCLPDKPPIPARLNTEATR